MAYQQIDPVFLAQFKTISKLPKDAQKSMRNSLFATMREYYDIPDYVRLKLTHNNPGNPFNNVLLNAVTGMPVLPEVEGQVSLDPTLVLGMSVDAALKLLCANSHLAFPATDAQVEDKNIVVKDGWVYFRARA